MSDAEVAGAVEVEDGAVIARLPTQPGDLVAAKYEVERILGAGGMGIVVSAVHLDLQERVAIKFMLPEVAVVPAAANRFLREAQATSRLKSERIARLHDVGRLDDGTPFMVMELLEGETLDRVIDREGPLPVETIVDLVLQACEPLDEAHRTGIVHRDVKPENLFLAERPGEGPLVKVLDFGISKVQTSISITIGNGMMGTATYSSPEQLRSPSDVGPSADVWSLGVILFEGLTTKLPFGGTSFAEICASVLHDVPARARTLRPDLPQALDDVVARCIARDDPSRITSMAALAEALAPFASEEGRALAARIVRRSSRRPDVGPSVSTPPPRLPEAAAAASEAVANGADASEAVAKGADASEAVANGADAREADARGGSAREAGHEDGEVRPSFAESVTPLAMDHGLASLPAPPRRRSRRAIAIGAVAAVVTAAGVALATRGGDAVPRLAGVGEAATATRVGPIARALTAAAIASALPPESDEDEPVVGPLARLVSEDPLDARPVDGVAQEVPASAPATPSPSKRPPAHASAVAPPKPRAAPRPHDGAAAPTDAPREAPTAGPPGSGEPAPAAAEALPGSTEEPPDDEVPAPLPTVPPPSSAAPTTESTGRGYPFGVVPIYP